MQIKMSMLKKNHHKKLFTTNYLKDNFLLGNFSATHVRYKSDSDDQIRWTNTNKEFDK